MRIGRRGPFLTFGEDSGSSSRRAHSSPAVPSFEHGDDSGEAAVRRYLETLQPRAEKLREEYESSVPASEQPSSDGDGDPHAWPVLPQQQGSGSPEVGASDEVPDTSSRCRTAGTAFTASTSSYDPEHGRCRTAGTASTASTCSYDPEPGRCRTAGTASTASTCSYDPEHGRHGELVTAGEGSEARVPTHTLMMSNLPCRITKEVLLRVIRDRGFEGLCWVYMPMRSTRRSHRGHAFVGFSSSEDAGRFAQMFTSYQFLSTKVPCVVTPARTRHMEQMGSPHIGQA